MESRNHSKKRGVIPKALRVGITFLKLLIMPLTKTNTGNAIPRIVVPNARQRERCYEVIAQLDFADLGRGAMTLHTVDDVRLDMQGRTAAGDANLAVQIGGGVCASAVISHTALIVNNTENQRGVSNAAISVLNQSLDTGNNWTLTGQLP